MFKKKHASRKKFPRYLTAVYFIFSFLIYTIQPALCLPQIDAVISGSANISYPNSNTLQINASDKTIINFKSFDINQNESVIFNLPNASSEILSKILSNNYSSIFGKLTSNGIVFLINTNGLFFGSTANINVHGLIASTRDITNSDFLTSNYKFTRNFKDIDRLLLNEGNININENGFALFIAGAIENKGSIICPVSKIAMAAGNAVRVSFPTDSNISIIIDEKTAQNVFDYNGKPLSDQIKNSGNIKADGGIVLLKAESMPELLTSAINLDGFISAIAIDDKTGSVKLVSNDNINVTGKISATNIDLISGSEIKSLGTLNAQDTITLSAVGAVSSLGILKANTLKEKGASFLLGGTSEVGLATMSNDDDAVTYSSGNYSGTYSDVANIILNNNAIINLTGSTTFNSDSDRSGSGAFIMNAGSSIIGNNYDLSLLASEQSTLRDITGVKKLYLYQGRSGSNPFYLANNPISASTSVDIRLSTLDMNSHDLITPIINSTGTLAAANYYVDSINGDDTKAGTSSLYPWKSLNKVNNATFKARDTVKFSRGGVWRGQIIPDSGDSSGYVTYTAYGTGPLPLILGSQSARTSNTDWVSLGNNLWKHKNSFVIDVGNLIFNNEAACGVKKWTQGDLKSQGDFWYDRNNKALVIYSTKNPSSYYSNIEAALRRNIFDISGGKHHVIIENFDLRYAGAHGIGGSSASYFIIQDNHISFIGGGDQNNNGVDRIRYGNGIEFFNNSHDTIVRRNFIDNVYDAGITTQGTANGNHKYNQYFYNNVISNCEYSFEYFNITDNRDSNTHDIYVENNTFIDAGKGWGHNQRPVKRGTNIMFGWDNGTLSNFFVRNNIAANATEHLVFFNNNNNIPKITMDYNLYYSTTGNLVYVQNYPAKAYSLSQLSTWKSAYGKDTNSIYGDPLFTDTFRLASNSPSINKGAYLPHISDDVLKQNRTQPYDIGAYEYTTVQAAQPPIQEDPLPSDQEPISPPQEEPLPSNPESQTPTQEDPAQTEPGNQTPAQDPEPQVPNPPIDEPNDDSDSNDDSDNTGIQFKLLTWLNIFKSSLFR